MRVGFDLDGVICDFTTAANLVLAELDRCEPKPVDAWDWYKQYGRQDGAHRPSWAKPGTPEHLWEQMWDRFHDDALFASLEPYEGAVEWVLKCESYGHEPVIITRREAHFEQDTVDWLVDNGLGHLPLFVVQSSKVGVTDVDVFVDDHPGNVADFLVAGTPAWLYDRPWNQGSLLPRVDGLGEYLDEVNVLKEYGHGWGQLVCESTRPAAVAPVIGELAG